MKKFFILLFSAAILMAAGCERPEPEPEPEPEPVVLDFAKGADVSWLTRNIISDELTGKRVNDAQNALKLAMEERFGTTLSETFTGDIWSTNYITRLVTSGDDSFDICYSLDLYAPGYIIGDCVIPYSELEHVDLSRIY